MGNKLNTHRKSGTDEQRSRKKRKKSQMKSAADDDKFVSCPDLGGAVPYKDQEDLNVNIKMHRSYKDLDITRDSEKEARPDIKIYRKSAGAELYQASTLPRSFGRSKSNVETRIPNGGAGTHVDIRRQRDTVDGRASRQGSSRRSSNLTVDRCSSRRVTIFMSDFPSTEDIQRRLRLFESHYCLRLVDYYSQLSDTLQVSALSIALRRTPTGSRTVSLLDYLSGRECQPPDDLFQDAARGDVVLTVPPSLIHGITHVRGQCGAGDMGLWTSLASDVVMCVATEASHEVARMYEYQVAVMDDNSVRLLADYGAMCVVEYIKAHSAFLDRNTAVLGVVYGRIPHLIHTPCVLSVIIGNKEELKWDINDVFKSPGLRKDVLLMRSSLKQDEDTLEDEEDFVEEQEELKKFRFYSTSTCDPLLYGYRGQLLEWDFMNGVYKLHPEDEDKFTRQYAHHPDDFHRTYPPYRRLLGIQLMREFCEHQSPGGYTSRKTLNELLTDSPGDVAGRLEVVPVYRPLEPTTERDGPRFDNVNLDGVDLTRVQLGRSDMTSGSLQNARLLLVEGHNAQWPARGIQGTDVSYSCIAPPPGGVPPGTTAKHVLITPTSPPVLNEQRMGGETRYLSDSQGNLINLQQVLEKHQKAAALESARRAAQVSSPEGPLVSSFASTTASDPSDAEKKVRRKKKKKRRQTDSGRASAAPSMDNANGSQRRQGSVNRSASSVESPEGVQVARVSQTRRANSAYNLEHSPPPRGPSRASAPGDSHEEPIRREEAHLHNQSFPETAVRSGPQLDVPQYSSSPAHQKAFSTTNVSVERRGSQRQQLSASQSHHGKLAAAPGGQGMTKSVSHHGHLSTRPRPGGGGHPVEAYGMGWLTTRRQLSQAEVEFIRRSQIFTMMQGLHIENLESNVSEADPWLWLGRQKDVDAVAELLSSAGRLVSITGTMGIGKSALAIAVAAKLRDQRFLAPFVVDCSGCQDIHSLHVRLMSLWDLHFTQNQMNHFYNWLNSHEQRLLVVFDNFEGLGEEQSAGESEKREISEYLDGLLENVKNLRVLCTGCSNLYCGSASSEVYHLQDLVGHSGDLVSKLAPDLHDEGIQALTEACDHVPIALTLVTRAFMMEDVDSGKLFEDLTLNTDGVFNVESLNDVVEAATKHNNSHKCRYAKLVRCVHILLLNLPDSTQQLLMRMARLSSFDVDVASALTMQKDNKQTVKVVEDLCKVGLLRCDDQERYRMPLLVKLVAKACNQQPQASWNKICTFYMDLIKKLCDQYHSTKCLQSINTFKANYDNIAQVLEFLVQREEIYEKCKDFSNEEYVLFLQSALSPCLYTDVYESLRVHAVDNKDERTHVLALCALALQCLQQEEQHCTALATMEQAYQLLHHWSPAHSTQRAFCLQCLARVRWVTADGQENRNRALVLAKRALDLYKQSTGLRNVRTLYANELYSWMLMKKESFQTARHYYNISDFVVKESLDEHPRLLEGYDCRRAIWDHVCLFARAIEMARKAVDVCQNFYGDHPVTADMWCRLCECIMKRGSLNEAIGAGVRTLAVRVKVLGDHADTAQAYKMLAYLMLRSGQYDEAVRFGQSALDIYDKLTTANIDGSSPPITESQRIDVKNIMSQARYRLEYKSSVFVELESKDASKTQIPGDDISTGGGGGGMIGGTAISTQV